MKKFKVILAFVMLGGIIWGSLWTLTNWSLHKGSVAAELTEFSATKSWPVRYEGVYLDLLSGEEKSFSAFEPEVVTALESSLGEKLILDVQTHFLSLWNSHAHSVRSLRKLERELGEGDQGIDQLCRLVEVIKRSRRMVEVLRERLQEYDPDLLESIRSCP